MQENSFLCLNARIKRNPWSTDAGKQLPVPERLNKAKSMGKNERKTDFCF